MKKSYEMLDLKNVTDNKEFWETVMYPWQKRGK